MNMAVDNGLVLPAVLGGVEGGKEVALAFPARGMGEATLLFNDIIDLNSGSAAPSNAGAGLQLNTLLRPTESFGPRLSLEFADSRLDAFSLDNASTGEFSQAQLTSAINGSSTLDQDEKELLLQSLQPLYDFNGGKSFSAERILEQLVLNLSDPDISNGQRNLGGLVDALDMVLTPGTISAPDLSQVRYLNIEINSGMLEDGQHLDHLGQTENVVLFQSPDLRSIQVLSAETVGTGKTFSEAADHLVELATRIERESGTKPQINLSWGGGTLINLVTTADGVDISRSSADWLIEGGWPTPLQFTLENLNTYPEELRSVLQHHADTADVDGVSLISSEQVDLGILHGIDKLLQADLEVWGSLQHNSVYVPWQIARPDENFTLVGSLNAVGEVDNLHVDSHPLAENLDYGTVLMLPEGLAPEDLGIEVDRLPNVSFINSVDADDKHAGQPLEGMLIPEDEFNAVMDDSKIAQFVKHRELNETVQHVYRALNSSRREGGIPQGQLDILSHLLFSDHGSLLKDKVISAGIELTAPRDGNVKQELFSVLNNPQELGALPVGTFSHQRYQTMEALIAEGLQGRLLTTQQAITASGLSTHLLPVNSVELGVSNDQNSYILITGVDQTREFTTVTNDRGVEILLEAASGSSYSSPRNMVRTGRIENQ